ncbi:hypothetical protein JWG45_06835 [Leptospira sp. 201903070]|uniref:DUF5683 domain-containing protein n=1 Tax=Leptospira ainlahdjerensis TaxID=2810033 RepID=A0ABS2U930_9LEPT|nr:hypothetical protein [Leptospira ainlahdjerensis]MBM9576867.1 hypothetical protein [Leptospira ainlahdjerensis]
MSPFFRILIQTISFCCILLSRESLADTILLKDNTTLTGRVIEYKEHSVRFSNAYETIEILSNQILNIEIGFHGIPTILKTKSEPEFYKCLLIHSNSDGKFTFYDKKKSELFIVEFKDIEFLEYTFPFDKINFKGVVGGYEVEISYKHGGIKTGILSAIRSNTTVLISNSKEISISNSTISKIVYKGKDLKETKKKEYTQSDRIRLYDILIPGLYQIRTERKSFGTFILFSTFLSALASRYEYERGKKELYKQREFNERSILLGEELGLLSADFSYEAYYEHKNNNRSLLILTSLFYMIHFFDLWSWNPILSKKNDSSFSILPSLRLPIGTDRLNPNAETNAQIRFQWKF